MKLTIVLTLIFQIALAANANRCKIHLHYALMDTIKNDQKDILEKIYLKTALKFITKILQKQKGEPLNQSLESYLGGFNISDESTYNVESSIKALKNRYGPETVNLTSSEYLAKVKNLKSGNSQLTNLELSVMMNSMNKKDNYDFDEVDESITWYTHQIGDHHSLSNFINGFFNANSDLTLDEASQLLKRTTNKLEFEFSKVKKNTYDKYTEDCINKLDPNAPGETASNSTVFFKSCSGDLSDQIMDNSLLTILKSINERLDPKSYYLRRQILDNNQKRELQDKINSKASDLDKVIGYYSSPLYNGECENFIIIDKKNHKLKVYDRKGVSHLEFPLILGKNDKGFNLDASTRFLEGRDTKISNSTGAGVFKFKEDKQFSDKDYYKEVYSGQLYSLNDDSGKESAMALHSVPMGPQAISNYHTRMKAFQTDGGNLSGGCLNLESYNYHIVKNHIEPNCPMIVLPQDESNYYFVKNGKLNFTSKDYAKKTKKDRFNYKGEDYLNKYNFTPRNLMTEDDNINEIETGAYTSIKAAEAKNYILANYQDIVSQNSTWIEKDGLEDALSLAIATAGHLKKEPSFLVEKFISMQEWCERNSNKGNLSYNYNTLPRAEKLKKIVRAFNQEVAGDNIDMRLDENKFSEMVISNIKIEYK